MDIHVPYTLTTPGGTITFNNGSLGDGTDKYWIQAINGLDQPQIRAPIDPVPFGNGSIIHTFWLHGFSFVIDGFLLIESSYSQGDCEELRNALEDDLRDALASIVAADGPLAWTPTGESAQSLTVRQNVAVSFPYSSDFRVKSFNFGLVSEASTLA